MLLFLALSFSFIHSCLLLNWVVFHTNSLLHHSSIKNNTLTLHFTFWSPSLLNQFESPANLLAKISQLEETKLHFLSMLVIHFWLSSFCWLLALFIYTNKRWTKHCLPLCFSHFYGSMCNVTSFLTYFNCKYNKISSK